MNNILSEIEKIHNKCNNAMVFLTVSSQINITYSDIFTLSKELCKKILNVCKNFERNSCMALVMTHNPYILPIVISALKLQCPFMFFDPRARLEQNFKDLDIKYVITVHNSKTTKSSTFSDYKLEFSDVHKEYIVEFRSNVKNDVSKELTDYNIMYIIQTSGSTGEKKIVRVEHHCIESNITCLRHKFLIDENDFVYFGTNLTFDPSMVELFLALTTGACLLSVSSEISASPGLLYDTLFIRKCVPRVTVIQMCPSLFLRWNMDDIKSILMNEHLKILALGGEQFPGIIKNFECAKNLRIFNLYGITEISCWASICEIHKDRDITLGTVLDDTVFEIRNKCGDKINEGFGELHIGSKNRICYINNEEKHYQDTVFRSTGDLVFLKNNEIYYEGRTSKDIIKRYGQRVNLQKIDTIVHNATGFEAKCIWTKNKIIMFVKITRSRINSKEKIIRKLKTNLRTLLESDWFPDVVEPVVEFPLTSSGKVCTKSLEVLANIKADAKNADLLMAFVTVWRNHLGMLPVECYIGRLFHELGGTSITKLQMISEIKELVQPQEYPSMFFDWMFRHKYEDIISSIKEHVFVRDRKRLYSGQRLTRNDRTGKCKLKIRWTYNLRACVDANPTILSKSNMVAIGSHSNNFAILNMETGKPICEITLPNVIVSACCSSPCERFVYVGCFDGNMYCIEIKTSTIIWQYETGDQIKNTPLHVLKETSIVFGSYDKHIHCVQVRNGSCVWKQDVQEEVSANICRCQEKECIFVATIHGTCWYLTEKSGSIVWSLKLRVPIFSSPCISNRHIILADVLGVIHVVNFDGCEVQKFITDGNIYSSLKSFQDYILFSCHDRICCLQWDGGSLELKFETELNSPSVSSVDIVNFRDKFYVAGVCRKGYLYIVNLESSLIDNEILLSEEVYSSPVVQDSCIYLGCRDDNLYCIEIES